ncbi:MAG: glycine C-acetyltransferase [Gammaproteobacteria bacterium RIFCSPLOWO2_02_FULL_42_14]|nr:MAG: glycine C-acetyltransferase [Gammaproteobacteria bacterium RIFCSPHIGHO2_02_FULL_42_43]OGT29277.1 MAG: glycine C-acetyltransferase [Gammaproteobacteria bacterium RIFCSPHIGHO2_01_FULL_42_8]OGT50867.1 MAG: glycine C-acetyltransferase [Gammaproteobacteria bacterium RIFCSPHIGHO2_12_FULL_41_25]OGT62538.1 MAG: glycine C-acetyltransferase [Gammaproteobacteria bacterium RIFCSPLOWO2_02_FULL_42_14]OGT86609.1 MAG: glycine C-acetyltransferase [Gammaproteobacteria bacterium RIFCSPLOWO2_12_FULL_42_18]
MHPFYAQLENQLTELKQNGLYKQERCITSPQNSDITVSPNQHVLNFCANNYLGLADHPALVEAAQHALKTYGFGMASVRFICGTQIIHKQLEKAISEFLKMDDTILYSSCFDANGGLFETVLSEEDAIISDELNHASIIDGIRLCKAKRLRYKNNDMQDLETQLKAADQAGARHKLIATDGVFSMDGIIANLKSICNLADQYHALVMVDDSHAVGFIGEHGRGTPELCGVLDRVDIITGTLGKALGGASGGYTAARGKIAEWLRNRSRPYLFSNTLAPVITATSLKVLEMVQSEIGKKLRDTVKENSHYFREKMTALGFTLVPGEHAIIPVMLGDAKIATAMADKLLQEYIYVIGFSYPVVPMNKARIRVQLSAAHTKVQLDKAIAAFEKIGKIMGVI